MRVQLLIVLGIEMTEAQPEQIKSLDFDKRLEIYAALLHDSRLDILRKLDDNNPSMSYTELKKTFNMNPNTLRYHLKVLREAGLVSNTYEKRGSKSEYSFYSNTDLGKRVLEAYKEEGDLTRLL